MLENILPVSEFRSKLPEVLKLIGKLRHPFIITQRGKPKAVLLDFEEYEGWLETLAIAAEKEWVKDLKKADADVKNRRLYSHKDVFGSAL